MLRWFWRLCGLQFLVTNDNGDASVPSLWVYSKEGMQINVLFSTTQHITLEVTIDAKVCCVSGVYASIGHVRRRKHWSDLLSIYDPIVVWSFIGDFNYVIGAHEKLGDLPSV